jgi:hypothetical protein
MGTHRARDAIGVVVAIIARVACARARRRVACAPRVSRGRVWDRARDSGRPRVDRFDSILIDLFDSID